MAQIPADVSPGDSGHDDHHDALHGLYNHLDTVGGGDVTAAWTAAEKSKLAAIEALATADQTGAQIKTAYEAEADTNAFDDAAVSKLAGIEAAADVTDTANVTAAGALMDSEVDADIKTLSLPASTTISTFGATLIDDADAATARTTLGITAGGSNDGAYDAITHSGSGAVNLNFNDSDVGFKVTASANITDITFSNGPTSGNQKRRTVEVVATATITVAFGTLDVVESGIPTSMVNGDKFMADLVVTA